MHLQNRKLSTLIGGPQKVARNLSHMAEQDKPELLNGICKGSLVGLGLEEWGRGSSEAVD